MDADEAFKLVKVLSPRLTNRQLQEITGYSKQSICKWKLYETYQDYLAATKDYQEKLAAKKTANKPQEITITETTSSGSEDIAPLNEVLVRLNEISNKLDALLSEKDKAKSFWGF
jgi:hypothetical protein